MTGEDAPAPGRREQLAGERDVHQDARARQQDQRDREQERRQAAADQREDQADAREQEADRRTEVLDLYREALRGSPGGAVEHSLWLKADSRAQLRRRHDQIDRDSAGLDRHEDRQHREQQAIARDQAEVQQQSTADPLPAVDADRSPGR